MSSGLMQNPAADKQRLSATAVLASLPFWASVLVVMPVFVQAPWVRQQPLSACLFGLVLTLAGILWSLKADRSEQGDFGALVLGFSGSWMAGSLFWGWLPAHPVLHVPVEAFALPLALAGLTTRWRCACAFYLASLIGTAFTDLSMALSGVMPLWPEVVTATSDQAPDLLRAAAAQVLTPKSLLVVIVAAALITRLVAVCRSRVDRLGDNSSAWSIASSVLFTTLVIDAVFLGVSLLAPSLSGLI
nr:DUF3120 domain-containing protein [Synechococcus sp. CS-197]